MRLSFVLALYFATTSISVLAQPNVPTPKSVLGHEVGADFELANYDETLEYFRRLDAASDRLQLVRIGKTSFGLDWYLALISSEENLARVEHYRGLARRLAHPRGLSEADARALSREGKAVVHIDGALHSTESATTQFPIQLAYDLVHDDEDPEIQAIRDNVILVLWFSMNPDGHNMMANWYRSHRGTPFEVAPMVELYQAYVGHDNNRDGYMINMIESRVVTRVVRHYAPQVLYNHHQTSPFPTRIWIPPFAEPVSTHVHPLMWRTVNSIGMAMAQTLEERGMRGATHMGTGFDNWYPGFMDHANNFHNVASFLTETALYRYATPKFYPVSEFPRNDRDLRPKSLYSSPWEGGWWRIRDAVDYMVVASLGVLDYAAKYRSDLLFNRYQAGRDVIAQFQKEPPFAYFIPRDQRDPVAPVEMLRRLAFNDIEVHELKESITHEGLTHEAGTWVILTAQEFGLFARQLFAIQDYPDLRAFPNGPRDHPYDVAGWTLPYQMDVRVVEASTPLSPVQIASLRRLETEPIPWENTSDASLFDSPRDSGFDTHPVAAAIRPAQGRASGEGDALVLDLAQNNSFRALHAAFEADAGVFYESGSHGEGADSKSGRYWISDAKAQDREKWVEDFALQAELHETYPGNLTSVSPVRLGLYRPWRASMDEGWTRWALERFGFQPKALRNAEVRAGSLRERFDVILIADMGSSTILNGHAKGTVPPQYAGGIGPEGVRHLETFVREGGTLVCLNGSCQFAIEQLELPVEIMSSKLDRKDYFAAGSLLAMDVDVSHPVMAGMPERAKILMAQSPVLTTKDGFEGSILAQYPKKGSILLSGYLVGEDKIRGYASAVDVHHGKGHVILLGFRPQWRGQPFGTFRILFNACLYQQSIADAHRPNESFWEKPEPKEKKDSKEKATKPAEKTTRMGER